ncbi:hypothetical protein WA538_005150, partial [Blastocystis sp. DL]
MSLVVALLGFVLFIVLLVALLDYMDFFKKPVIKADILQANTYIAFTFRGTLGDITLCTRYALKEIRKVTGRINYFPKIYCLYHNHEDVNPATNTIQYTLLFPVDSVSGLKEKIDQSEKKDSLFLFSLPSLRIASTSFTFRNFLSYSLGQMRIYPFITKYARKNGITDTNTVLECYSTDNPIIYSLVLEKTELFDVLRNRSPVLVDQIFRREAW